MDQSDCSESDVSKLQDRQRAVQRFAAAAETLVLARITQQWSEAMGEAEQTPAAQGSGDCQAEPDQGAVPDQQQASSIAAAPAVSQPPDSAPMAASTGNEPSVAPADPPAEQQQAEAPPVAPSGLTGLGALLAQVQAAQEERDTFKQQLAR